MAAGDRYVLLEDVQKAMAACATRIDGRATSAPEYLAPFDGGNALRPHDKHGRFWQVWSGNMCIALLRSEDVAAAQRQGVDK